MRSSPDFKSFRDNLLPIAAHFLVLALAYALLLQLGMLKLSPLHEPLALWDAGNYASIRDHGYVMFTSDNGGNVGFYPFFAYLWRWLRLGEIGISLLNLGLASCAMAWLAAVFGWSRKHLLLLLSIPSVMFLYLPFTESLFFCGSAMALAGLKMNRRALLLSGLLLASLARPTVMFFLPALFLAELCSFDPQAPRTFRKFFFTFAAEVAVVLSGMLAVALVQWWQVGDPLAYFKAQIWFMDHGFRWPEFPLTTWDGPRLLWLDGAAFAACCMALSLCCASLWMRIRRRKAKQLTFDRALLFSAGYLAMLVFYVLFFHKHDEVGGTSIFSLNRYVFATPFFFVFAFAFLDGPEPGRRRLTLLLLLAAALVMLLGQSQTFSWSPAWGDVRNGLTWYRLLMLAGITLFLLLGCKARWTWAGWTALYIFCAYFQLYYLDQYLAGAWVG